MTLFFFAGWSGGATGGRWDQKTSGPLGERTPQKNLFPSWKGNGRGTAMQPRGECVEAERAQLHGWLAKFLIWPQIQPPTLLWLDLHSPFPACGCH